MRLIIEPNYEQLSKWAANYVAAKIKKANPTAEKPFLLGLPTGSSPKAQHSSYLSAFRACFCSTGTPTTSHFIFSPNAAKFFTAAPAQVKEPK